MTCPPSIRGGAYEAIIADHAGPDAAHRAVTDPAWATLVRALGAAQLLGWDSRQLLIQAITQRELGTAARCGGRAALAVREHHRHWREAPDPPCSRAAELARAGRPDPRRRPRRDPVRPGQHRRRRRPAAGRRRDGQPRRRSSPTGTPSRPPPGSTAATRTAPCPRWLTALGPVPTTGRDLDARREAWLRHARAVAIYHDATGYQPTATDPIGPRPPAGDPEARELWTAARAALADAPIAATMRAMLPDRLHAWVAEAVHAETAEQPAYVGHDLRSLTCAPAPSAPASHRLRQEATATAGKLATAERRRWRRDQTAIASLRRTHHEHRRATRTKPGHAAPDRT